MVVVLEGRAGLGEVLAAAFAWAGSMVGLREGSDISGSPGERTGSSDVQLMLMRGAVKRPSLTTIYY